MDNFLILFSGLLGLLCGILINYLSDVLPATRSLTRPACWHCAQPKKWVDFLLLRKCGICSSFPRTRAYIVLVLMFIISIFIWIFPRTLPYLLSMLVITYFLIVIIIDVEHRAVLYPTSIAGAIIAFGTGIYLRGSESLLQGITTSLIGGAVGFSIMLVFYWLGILYVRRLAKKKALPPDEVALGFGDVTLSGIIGLILGWPAIIGGLLYGVLAGGVVSLLIIFFMLITKKYQAFKAIPYAPFLILAAAYLLFL